MNVNKIFGLIGLTVTVLLLSAGSIFAQCGVIRRGPIFHNSCATPVITKVVATPVVAVTPVAVAVPVLVPAFQFQYAPPCAVPVPVGYAGQPGIVPGNYGQPVVNQGMGYAQQPGYSPGYNPQSQQGYGPPPVAQQPAPIVNNQDKIRELARALLEEMQRQQPGDDGPPAVPGANTGSPPGVPSGNPSGNPPGLPTASVISPEQAAPIAIAALQQNCASCHTGPSSKGEFVMFAQPGLFSQNVPWRSIIREIDAGRMPPNYSQFRLSPQQAGAIRDWLRGI